MMTKQAPDKAYQQALQTKETRRLSLLSDKDLCVEWVGGKGKTRRGNPSYKIKVVARSSLGAVLMVPGYCLLMAPHERKDHYPDRPEYPELWFWDFVTGQSERVFESTWNNKVTPSVKRWAREKYCPGSPTPASGSPAGTPTPREQESEAYSKGFEDARRLDRFELLSLLLRGRLDPDALKDPEQATAWLDRHFPLKGKEPTPS